MRLGSERDTAGPGGDWATSSSNRRSPSCATRTWQAAGAVGSVDLAIRRLSHVGPYCVGRRRFVLGCVPGFRRCRPRRWPPLDPLTGDEITTAFRVIEESRDLPATAFFPIVALQEPPKAEVLSWSPGRPFRREAFAQVYDRAANRLFEAVVDLRRERLRSFVERPGAQPAVFGDEYESADAAVRRDARWRRAMARRGIDPDDVFLDVWAPGELNLPMAGAGVRFLRALSFFAGDLPNAYDRPIEGVLVTIDANRMQVVDVQDTGRRPVNRTASDEPGGTRPPLAPLVVTQPEGPGFTIRGSEVTWQGWRFRVGFNPREGVVLHQIGFERGGRVRPIIYRLALDEIYVPYALPDPTWSWRAALDIGEYNLGQFLERLQPGVDVPTNAVFLDEFTPSDLGSAGDPPVIRLENGVALYERDSGVLWDRIDAATGDRKARFGRELVVTSTMPNGNYTYTVDYVFRLDGGIDVLAGATGTLLTRGVASAAPATRSGPSWRRGSRRPAISTSSTSGWTSTSTACVTGSSRQTPERCPAPTGTRSTPMNRSSRARASATPPRPPTGTGSWKARRRTARSATTPPTNCART